MAARRPRRFWWGWSLALTLTTLVVVLATVPPFVGPELRAALMQGFSTVCHQLPARSPSVDGVPLAVCHRCYGLYWGLPLAVLGFLLVAPRRSARLQQRAPWVLALALVPLTFDWLLGVTGLWENTPWSRAVTGALFGVVAGFYLARGFSRLFVTTPGAAVEEPGVTPTPESR